MHIHRLVTDQACWTQRCWLIILITFYLRFAEIVLSCIRFGFRWNLDSCGEIGCHETKIHSLNNLISIRAFKVTKFSRSLREGHKIAYEHITVMLENYISCHQCIISIFQYILTFRDRMYHMTRIRMSIFYFNVFNIKLHLHSIAATEYIIWLHGDFRE